VDIAAGVLATPLSSDALNCIVWLRKEQPRTVNWAGNYADGLVKNAVGNFRLTPRKSFELWEESWRGRSVPWTPVELGIAAMMALALPESLAQKNKIAQEQEKLKQAEEEIRTMAFYDSLTKLPNRRLLGDRLTQTMAASKRSGSYVAVFFLDLDNFKSLNDTNGHAVGDLLLIEVARRLKSCLREVDTAARLGGDEFVVVLSELGVDKFKSIQQAESVAEKIREALAATYVLNVEHEEDKHNIVEHRCTSSIGAVVFVNHEVSQDDILKYADNAMYQAKHAGRNTVRFYNFTN
jgi:diguanylate cyclase (GGDEF)-like protein